MNAPPSSPAPTPETDPARSFLVSEPAFLRVADQKVGHKARFDPSSPCWSVATPLQPACDLGDGVCLLTVLDAANDRLKASEGVHCWSKVVLTLFSLSASVVRSVAIGRHEAEQGVDFVYLSLSSLCPRGCLGRVEFDFIMFLDLF